ncbi:hypothetical protein MMC13_005591 [Lambiella insularis]|nr:hypothetical protein [Lambiella insularis]
MACMKGGFVEGLVLDGRFESISPLNHGSFGMVFLAKDLNNGDHVAIKCLGKSTSNITCPATSENDHLLELACHDRLGYHPNIVNLLHAFETDAHMYLVLEFCSMGDLYEAIRHGRGPLETEHVRSFMLQLVNAVEFMHSKGLYHRDIKPENIFLTQDGSMKLGDFGLSTTESWTFESAVGSDRYMAPEQFDPSDSGYCPAQADVWAVGICLLNILFCRNPFVTPSEADLLFADFVRDRQSLFDIFPNMSQDTFEVLVHALSIDPKKRSLSAIRETLQRVISFTTDDDVFDDFCTDDREVIPASANRQPLRTPSVQSPPIEQGGAFPWARALHMSPPQTARQLSAIPDTELYSEDLFPETEKATSGWFPNPAQTPSLASILDSTLGASVKSMNLHQPKPRNAASSDATPVSGSLPITAPKPVPAMSSVFGQKPNTVSKSWSDMWDEDVEEEIEDSRRRFNGMNWSSESVDEDVTIRPSAFSGAKVPGLSESRDPSPLKDVFGVSDGESSENLGSFENLPKAAYKLPAYSPPIKRSNSFLDKWAALGNRRRAFNSSSITEEEHDVGRKRTSSGGIWRRGFGSGFGMKKTPANTVYGAGTGSGSWERKDKVKGASGVETKIRDWRRDQPVDQYHHGKRFSTASEDTGEGDLEWVGGWSDLHL